jgi:hypothetical protein
MLGKVRLNSNFGLIITFSDQYSSKFGAKAVFSKISKMFVDN